jgi:hypothetical protein
VNGDTILGFPVVLIILAILVVGCAVFVGKHTGRGDDDLHDPPPSHPVHRNPRAPQ